MSSDAVTRRLQRSSDLRDLCIALMKAKKLSDKKAAKEDSIAHSAKASKHNGTEVK